MIRSTYSQPRLAIWFNPPPVVYQWCEDSSLATGGLTGISAFSEMARLWHFLREQATLAASIPQPSIRWLGRH